MHARSRRLGGNWAPYLSERQWGTVREDYSQDGDAWNYFSHDRSRSRAYHWGEDGLAGISRRLSPMGAHASNYSMKPRKRRVSVPEFVPPMKASLVDQLPTGAEWL
jgi:hypothetical protein